MQKNKYNYFVHESEVCAMEETEKTETVLEVKPEVKEKNVKKSTKKSEKVKSKVENPEPEISRPV